MFSEKKWRAHMLACASNHNDQLPPFCNAVNTTFLASVIMLAANFVLAHRGWLACSEGLLCSLKKAASHAHQSCLAGSLNLPQLLKDLGLICSSQLPYLGLLAEMDETTACASMTLLRLKSATFTRQCLSTNKLGDFRSRCRMGGLCECSCSIPCTRQ